MNAAPLALNKWAERPARSVALSYAAHRAAATEERLKQREECEHPPGPPFFGAIGIIARQIAGGTNSAIVHRPNSEIAALPCDLRGEIDLVVRRANAGAELNQEIGRARTKLSGHRVDRGRHHPKLGAFLARMDQANGVANGIDEINRAAIGDVNAETNATLTCNQSVAVLETFVSANRGIDKGDIFSMNLLRGNERQISDPVFAADFPVHSVQPRERFRLIVRHLETRDAQRETVNDLGQRLQRRELFSRKLTLAHLPDVVVRVVRVVVLVGTGGRLPA
jgi:hypothetical protein